MTRAGRAPRYDLPRAAPAGLRLVQELVNTSADETGRELLGQPDEATRWMADRGLLEEGARVDARGLRRIVAVREAVRGLLVENNGGDPHPAARATLAEAALRARLTVRWRDGTVRLEPCATGVDGALGRVLVEAVAAAQQGTWVRLKACRSCHWAFYDASRNRSASWCSMQLCGNRRKTRDYRRRQLAQR